MAIDPGRDIFDELARFFKRRQIQLCAVFNAIGMLNNVQLSQMGRTAPLVLDGPVELLNASGVIRRENNVMNVNLSIMVCLCGKLFAGKLSRGCVAAPPEGVTIFLSVISTEGKVLTQIVSSYLARFSSDLQIRARVTDFQR